jgi:hypothetical protein
MYPFYSLLKCVLMVSSHRNPGVPVGTFLCLPARMLYSLLISPKHAAYAAQKILASTTVLGEEQTYSL